MKPSDELLIELILNQDLPNLEQYFAKNPTELALSSYAGDSWLHRASAFNRPEVIKLLIGLGLDVTHKADRSGDSSLSTAIACGSIEAVEVLLENGASPVDQDLVLAVASGSFKLVKMIFGAGASPLVRSGKPPRNAYEQATRLGNVEMQRLLAPKDASFDLFAYLISQYGEVVETDLPQLPLNAPFAVKCFEKDGFRIVGTYGLSMHPQPQLPYRCELAMRVPKCWPNTKELGAEPLWPFEYLLDVAASSLQTTLLQTFDTVGNGEPPQPLAPGVPFCGAMIVPENYEAMPHDANGNPIKLFSLQPLFKEELALARKNIKTFVAKMDRSGFVPTSLMNFQRKNVGKGLFWFLAS